MITRFVFKRLSRTLFTIRLLCIVGSALALLTLCGSLLIHPPLKAQQRVASLIAPIDCFALALPPWIALKTRLATFICLRDFLAVAVMVIMLLRYLCLQIAVSPQPPFRADSKPLQTGSPVTGGLTLFNRRLRRLYACQKRCSTPYAMPAPEISAST